jgi:4-amino-4-deoxy-L-arabinose transferase-like glycosyltransferase
MSSITNETQVTLSRTYHRYDFLVWLVAIVLLIVGLGVRLSDLTDEPLDFHPTRQLRGAIIARGIYYGMLPNADPQLRKMAVNFANSTGQYEPPILETLVAFTYRIIGGEHLWVAHIYSSIFWIIGGMALFVLAKRMFTPSAALVSLGYYLLLPFSAQASRSFQPDPSMVMWLILTVYALFRWSQDQTWKWTILAGLFGGMAIITKAVSVYIVAAAALATVLSTLGFRQSLRRIQVWVMAALMVAPSAIYYLVQHQGRASEYFANWTLALSHLIIEPAFYMRWFNLIQSLMGFTILLLAGLGVLISKARDKTLLFGLWIGYFIYGLTVPYQMYTHTYYHLQLVPILSLSIAPVAQVIIEKLKDQRKVWQVIFAGIAILAVVFPAWVSITTFTSEDHRNEPAYWQKIGSLLPTDGKILALTQDYGYRLLYYGWRKVTLWQTSGEQGLADLRGKEKDFEASFTNKIEGKDYFVITAFNQLNSQPKLKEFLSTNYPILADGNGYLIYDLTHPLNPQP